MRRIWTCALLSVALAGLVGCAATYYPDYPRRTVVHADISFFYQELAPHGHWFQHRHHGWVWTPYGVAYGWRPYSQGHWIYTQYGWTWVSDWAWGWGPFHYGRWIFDPDYGWVWIPGNVWAPAWVVWRWGGGWVGWAPLPPEVRWKAGAGLDAAEGPTKWKVHTPGWCFVKERWLADARIREKLEPSARNVTLIDVSTVVSDYDEFERRPRNRGPNVAVIDGLVDSHVPRLVATGTGWPREAGRTMPNGEIRVFRPEIAPRAEDAPLVTPRNLLPATPQPAAEVRTEEQKRLDATFRQQSEKLRTVQRAERKKPPDGLDPAEIRRRQELEQRALAEQRERQKQILERRVKEGIVKPQGKATTRRETKPERKE